MYNAGQWLTTTCAHMLRTYVAKPVCGSNNKDVAPVIHSVHEAEQRGYHTGMHLTSKRQLEMCTFWKQIDLIMTRSMIKTPLNFYVLF